MLTLAGRTAMVIGGSGCIGFEIVKSLLDGGMNVASVSSVLQKADVTSERLKEYGDRFMATASKGRSMAEVIDQIENRYGCLDVTVTCQGAPPIIGEPESMTRAHWNHILNSHLDTNLSLFQEGVPYLRRSKAPRMILTTCAEARCGEGIDDLAYNTAKGGIISMTYSEARRLAKYGITVNAVAVGGIYNLSYMPGEEVKKPFAELEDLKKKIPMGRLATPADVAAAVCYLASEEAGFVTGEILNVSGGLAMG